MPTYYQKASGNAILPNPNSWSHDAFGVQRVSSPEALFYSKMVYGPEAMDRFIEVQETGDVLTTHSNSSLILTTVSQNDKAIVQSRQYPKYQPGRSHRMLITGVLHGGSDGVSKKMGLFDANDGVCIWRDGNNGIKLLERGFGSDISVVTQAQFNRDTMDDVDFSKELLMWIDIEYLGVGDVRVGFFVGGEARCAHVFTHKSTLTRPYMRRASLPVRWEIEQTGATTGSMVAICACVDAEGGTDDELGLGYSDSNGATGISCPTGADKPVISIRPALTVNGIENRITVTPIEITLYVTANPALIKLNYHGAVAGGSWVAVAPYSAAESNKTATSISGGHVTNQKYVPAGAAPSSYGSTVLGGNSKIPVALDIDGTDQSCGMSVTARGIGGTTVVYAALAWKETL